MNISSVYNQKCLECPRVKEAMLTSRSATNLAGKITTSTLETGPDAEQRVAETIMDSQYGDFMKGAGIKTADELLAAIRADRLSIFNMLDGISSAASETVEDLTEACPVGPVEIRGQRQDIGAVTVTLCASAILAGTSDTEYVQVDRE